MSGPGGRSEKWRPSLAFVLGGALVGTLGLALIGLVMLRLLGPQIGFLNAAALIATLIAALTAGCGWLLVRLLLRPVRALSDYATHVRAGDSETVAVPTHFGTQELRLMGEAVVDMAEAFQTREATIRSYSDHVTHELKTPVSVIVAASELLADQMPPGQDQTLVDQISGAAQQMNRQLDALRQVVRAREVDYRGQTTLSQVVPGVADAFPSVEIVARGDDEVIPLSDQGVRLILEHLVDNARNHGATTLHISLSSTGHLDIVDNGVGLNGADPTKIFEPLYTTRRETGGTGMGLAIVKSVLAAHGGEIEVLPSDTGAAFRIRFA